MATSAQPPNLFQSLAEWLLDQGISDTSLEDLIADMGRRLVAGGVALHRISAGSIILHPVNPGLSITWEAAEDTVNRTRMPHHILATEGFKNAPFNYLFTENIPYKRFRLENGLMEPEFPIFESLREAGVPEEQLIGSQGGEHHRLNEDVTVKVFPSLHSCIWTRAAALSATVPRRHLPQA